MLNTLRIETDLFKASLTHPTGTIQVRILSSGGQWIETQPYANTSIGITAMLDLAMGVHSGRISLKGVAKEREGEEKRGGGKKISSFKNIARLEGRQNDD